MSKAVNAGVDAQIGFEQQRNTAIFLLLENYDTLRDKEFFISIEHHDDFLFAFTTNGDISEVEAYQSKKKNSGIWRINNAFLEIIGKILQTGKSLKNDSHPKTSDYNHKLYFISNQISQLKASKKYQKTDQENEIGVGVQNQIQPFNKLPLGIQETVKENLQKFTNNFAELDNFIIQFIDFPFQPKSQTEILIGKIYSKFSVVCPKSALCLLNELFDEVGQTYNQAGQVSLADISKQVSSREIKKAISIITDEQKTFNLWRENAKDFSQHMNLTVHDQKNSEATIGKTFEYLKDFNNLDHQKIQLYVKENNLQHLHYDEIHIVKDYVDQVKKQHNLNITEKDIFWTCLCSYVQYYQ
ncbi:hypothetical protein QJU23_04350 [Pasteurella atlantica]|uniref:Uncharacterized protein n=2 Tax=Pasteurellaceae TaxID=712 RepID=A0ACC6HLH7_9PAST|nr:hypothetical protein [Pasteurella atlantica]